MERVTHSRRPSKAAVTLSNNSATFSGTSLYDDVYGGPPKFGASNLSPRLEDYAEIFGSFRTPRVSSVPVLDLPLVHEAEAFFDPRSDDFDYTEVFGALDFAVPHENLFHQPGALNGDSSEEAWTPAETDSFSGESDHYENNQSFSNGDFFQSVDGNTEFNISYHKVNVTGNDHMSKRKTHMTELHAVPGFSHVHDETTRLHRTGPSFEVADDIDLGIGFSADKVKGNHMRKSMPHMCNFTSGEQNFGSDLNLQNEFIRNDSHSSEAFITVSGISLKSIPSQAPAPSRPPPVEKKGDINGFHSNSTLDASEEKSRGYCSPPFLDVEFGMNSSGAASDDALKEAMRRAEAKLRSAKESKKGTKGVYESHVKSSYVVKNNGPKSTEDMSRLNSLNDETMQESFDRRHSKMKTSVKDERQKPRKAFPKALDTLEGERVLNMFEDKHTKQSWSSQESDKRTGARIWKEEPEFFELEGTKDPGMVTQHTEQTKILVQDTGNQEHIWMEREASDMQENNKKVKAIKENYQWEEYDKKPKAAKAAYEHDKNIMRSEASDEKWRQREHVKKENVAKMFELEKNVTIGHQHGKIEEKATEADQSGSVELEDVPDVEHTEHKQVKIQKPKEVHRQTPNEDPLSMSLKENEKKPKEVVKLQQNVKKHKLSVKMKESGKPRSEAFALGQTKDEEKLEDFVELEDIERPKEEFKQSHTGESVAGRVENEIRFKLTNQILNKKGLKEALERVETEKSFQGSFEKEESNEGLRHAFEWDDNEKKHKGDFQLDVNEIRLKEAFKQRVNNEMENEVYERGQNRKNFEEACHGYGEGRRLTEAAKNTGAQKVLSEAPEKEQKDEVVIGDQRKREIEIMLNETFIREGSTTLSNKNSLPKQFENMGIDVGRMEKYEGPDKALDKMEGNEGENVNFTEVTDETWETESDEELFESASTHDENVSRPEVSQESVAGQEVGKTRTGCGVREKNLEGIGIENPPAKEKIRAPEMVPGDTEHSGTQSGKVDDTVAEADYRRSTKAAEPTTVKESVNVLKTAECSHAGQSTERKEKSFNETTLVNNAERMRRESESEKDYLRKIEGERDREREREKDRMAVEKARLDAERERERKKDRKAVDRAIFEARDRAYAEACERAERAAFERATAEVQQRALAEAKERLEKACAEARDKSYLDKVTIEARLKAERAAVEKETVEAQERAKEKLKDEKATLESRERLERSVSDTLGFCSREGARLDSSLSDLSSSEGCRYPYSLYGAASFSERSEREGESAQRCRARLERHRRTAERAAKALAEKNMRDLVAQKEQAERNRLAESLDAEVRRWSGGKEGNLRALLSTLQYILGPDSGWHSIPLTDVITAVGVKKAYRKATLVVHPDKLQQRGASIQHKYICEKVFDLLKEAWNKFNSEER
ncbi:auxilin-like protein 1 [Lotus japonicus]|uniref:auxilin-like protein 1 n=1 Tax=Lotus japonicus TaxID=34305 RepID=UPI0025879C29|nr:auxilin-like protein 1 [Lotus japonicus]XP_057449357.1 auxilin-like protein 1 [Lotus japonicus]